MAMKGSAVPVFRRPTGQAEAGPIIRRANDPMTEADITCAIMAACLADEDGGGKARLGAMGLKRGASGLPTLPMPFCLIF